jgi:hypothetical protein
LTSPYSVGKTSSVFFQNVFYTMIYFIKIWNDKKIWVRKCNCIYHFKWLQFTKKNYFEEILKIGLVVLLSKLSIKATLHFMHMSKHNQGGNTKSSIFNLFQWFCNSNYQSNIKHELGIMWSPTRQDKGCNMGVCFFQWNLLPLCSLYSQGDSMHGKLFSIANMLVNFLTLRSHFLWKHE